MKEKRPLQIEKLDTRILLAADFDATIEDFKSPSIIDGLYAPPSRGQTLTSIVISPKEVEVLYGGQQQFSAVAYDQNGNVMSAKFSWSINDSTMGSINNKGLFTASSKEGSVTVKVTSSKVSTTATVSVKAPFSQVLTTIQLTPGYSEIEVGQSKELTAVGYDQNGNVMTSQPTWQWSSTGGTINNGMFTTNQAGEFTITVQSGGVSANAIVKATEKPSLFINEDIKQLVDWYYADLNIDRNEMINILKFIGDDDMIVDDGELTDVRMVIVSSYYVMPEYVRELARDVTHSSPANLRFKGQALGNLTAGSSSDHLNKLIDKWFYGADVPALLGSNVSYVQSNGVLYNGDLTLNQTKQGYVGDCYLIASVVSIAGKDPEKIKAAFIDNGDNTYTVRWYSSVGVADYVTVNKMLPSSNGNLYYAGLGQNVLSDISALWGALLEKAYAQWNETGNAGRNGTNSYAGIEGGWMHNVNRQLLGYNSQNFYFSSSTEQTLRNEINAGKAVTVGTNGTVAAGWVGGHAYVVTGYNATNNTYSLINPWGYNHLNVTWAQMVSNCILFTTTQVV
jgi:hypothetical protein